MKSPLSSPDVIVIGGGVGGCVVALRLAEHGRRVLVVEAGPASPLPDGLRRLDVEQSGGSRRRWSGVTVSPGGADRPYLQGRGLGGSGGLNGAVLAMPTSSELNRWSAATGSDQWAPDSFVAGAERAVEALGSTLLCDDTAGLDLDDMFAPLAPVSAGSTLTGESAGLFVPALAAQRSDDGVISRVLVADRLAELPTRIEVRSESVVVRLLGDDGRVTGVQLAGGDVVTADEVVVCAGSVQTPLLLQRSEMLGKAITGLDHASVALPFSVPLRSDANGGDHQSLVRRVGRWAPMATVDSGQAGEVVLHVIGPLTGDRTERSSPWLALLSPGLAARRAVHSEGSSVVLGGLQWDRDCIDVMTSAVRAATEQISDCLISGGADVELTPDLRRDLSHQPKDADAVLRWMNQFAGPTYHLSSTLASTSILGSSRAIGRLDGWSNLAVADASVLPGLPAVGPQLAVMAVAELVSEALLM